MSNIEEDSLAEIQELIDAEQYVEALKVALKALGYTYRETDNSLEKLVEDLGFDASIEYDEGMGMDVLVINVNLLL